ncbi:MAG: ABC transporter permease [Ignavibacteriaceae bacterium]|jgi:lipoprotein-releasing system permease protein
MRFYLLIIKNILFSKKERKFVNIFISIAIAGIALGVATLIIALSVLNGYEKLVTKKLLQLDAHIQITGFGNKPLLNYQKTEKEVLRLIENDIVSIQPFISKVGILGKNRIKEGISLYGVRQNYFNSNKGFKILKGNIFDENSNQVVLGKSIAGKLMAGVGDTLKLFAMSNESNFFNNSTPIVENLIVSGIFESGMSKFDESYVLVDLNTLQNIFTMQHAVSGFEIKLSSLNGVDSLANLLQDNLRYPAYVKTIFQNYKAIFTWIELQKKPIPIILALIILVAVFNIISTLLMIVIEKSGFIGTLRILGARQLQIVIIFLIQGIVIGIAGIAFGNLLALILMKIQTTFNIITLPSTVYFVSEVPLFYQLWISVLVSALTFGVTLLVSVLPSFIASRIQPVTTLRFS